MRRFLGVLSRYHLLVAVLLAATVTAWQVYREDLPEPVADQMLYLQITEGLNASGVFSNGYPDDDGKYEPGAFIAPLYPGFLALLSAIEPEVAEAVHCYAFKERSTCDPGGLRSVVFLQYLMAVISALALYWVFLNIWESRTVALCGLVVLLLTGVLSSYAPYYLTENLAFLNFFLTMACLLEGLLRGGRKWFALGGFFLALAALSRPGYYYLIIFLAFVLPLWLRFFAREGWWFSIRSAFFFAIVALLVLAPWSLRNFYLFDSYAVTDGYAAFILVQRLAYNMMTWGEFAVAFVYWLPDFGDSLAAALFDEQMYRRLSWYEPDTFYSLGNGEFRKQTLAAAGSREAHFGYLLDNYLIADLGKHVAVTFALAWRGIWTAKYVGLVGFFCLLSTLVVLRNRRGYAAFLLLCVSNFFMLGLNAFVSVNVSRYNDPLVGVYVIGAVTVLCLLGGKAVERLGLSRWRLA